MRNIKLIIEYDGTNYCGWQRQKNGVSVQEAIEKVLEKILRENAKLTGAGRTDSGVHAKGQAANFRTSSRLAPERIKNALNANLPSDISIKSVKGVKEGFNAQFDAKSKIYRYLICNSKDRSPFLGRYSVNFDYTLDIPSMRKAAKALLGRHDFSSFKSLHSSAKTSVRNLKGLTIRKKGIWISIDVEADGFLYNMVRAIVGTLVEIGRGKVPVRMIEKILNGRNRSFAGPTLPAKGLTLMKVKY